ncbi:MAG TPA: hypothetical protein VM690_01495 [Gaiellaceae bacterium]|nr:hypothetical protein [Gaiellaceae bacterium]
MELDDVRAGFVANGIPVELVDEVLATYTEAKRRFHLRDLRPQEVEGGRFSEAVFRVLQHLCGQRVTPIGKSLPGVDNLLPVFESVTGQPDAVRLHIPRTLRLIYDIRNKRDAAHLSDQIDPNLQDATLVIANMDWVVAELVRLQHNVTADEAQAIIENLVTKEIPAVEEIDGQPVVLSDLSSRDQALLMLYRAGAAGASLEDLADWLRTRRDHLGDRLAKLDADKRVLRHPRSGRYHLTSKGVRDVEKRNLAQPAVS